MKLNEVNAPSVPSEVANMEVIGSGSCGQNVKWTMYSDGDIYDYANIVLVISGKGRMDDYNNCQSPWDKYFDYIGTAEYPARDGKVIIEEGITYVEDYSFYAGCISPMQIKFPSTLEEIGEGIIGAKSYTSAYAETIEIPANVSSIHPMAFQCQVENFVVDENNKYYASKDGVLFSKDMSQLIIYPGGKSLDSYVVPSSVESIYQTAFMAYETFCSHPDIDSSASITIPSTVKEFIPVDLGEEYYYKYPFVFISGVQDSYQYTSFEVKGVVGSAAENFVKQIKSEYEYNKITFTAIEKSTPVVEDKEEDNTSENVPIIASPYENGLKYMLDYLKEVPQTVINDEYMFNLSRTWIADFDDDGKYEIALYYLTEDKKHYKVRLLDISEQGIEVKKDVYSECSNGEYMFTVGQKDGKVKWISMENGGEIAYPSTKSINISDYKTDFNGKLILFNINGETEVYSEQEYDKIIKEKLFSIRNTSEKGKGIFLALSNDDFSDATAYSSAFIGRNVTKIPENAFKDCNILNFVIISDSVTEIGENAFKNCISLKGIEIPESVEKIDDYAVGYLEDNYKMDGFIIYGVKGSAAENYAKENNFIFIPVEPLSANIQNSESVTIEGLSVEENTVNLNGKSAKSNQIISIVLISVGVILIVIAVLMFVLKKHIALRIIFTVLAIADIIASIIFITSVNNSKPTVVNNSSGIYFDSFKYNYNDVFDNNEKYIEAIGANNKSNSKLYDAGNICFQNKNYIHAIIVFTYLTNQEYNEESSVLMIKSIYDYVLTLIENNQHNEAVFYLQKLDELGCLDDRTQFNEQMYIVANNFKEQQDYFRAC